jgi:DNA-binding CsgD family transcriptional regulator/PAS domain-containing protein
MAQPNLDAVLATLDSLLAGALDSEQLPAAIERMRGLFEGSKACFARFGPDMGPDDAIATDPDPTFQALCYGDLAPEFADFASVVASVPVGQIYRDDELVMRDQWRRSRVWREWMAPQDMYGGMACRVLQDGASFWLVDVQRGNNRPRFDADDIALFEHVSGVIRRIGMLQRHVGRLKIQRDMTRHALDVLSVAVLIVDPSLRLVYANGMADEILAAPNSALCLRGGRPAAAERADLASLKQVVAGMGAKGAISSSCRNQLMIGAARGKRQGVAISVMPLPSSYGLPNGPSDVLLLAKPLTPQADLAAMGQQLFGLTEAEARFASAVALGRSLAEAAEEQGVRISTARTHLARIFQKTGTRQQSQVAALLRSAELPLRA